MSLIYCPLNWGNFKEQYVCVQCGFNMIGEMPDVCPFCDAKHDVFQSWDTAEKNFTVTPTTVNDYVTQLCLPIIIFLVPPINIEKICDYAFPPGADMKLNPYNSNKGKTIAGANKFIEIATKMTNRKDAN